MTEERPSLSTGHLLSLV
jgi:hypothetical protein